MIPDILTTFLLTKLLPRVATAGYKCGTEDISVRIALVLLIPGSVLLSQKINERLSTMMHDCQCTCFFFALLLLYLYDHNFDSSS
jgi:hypothetical protein